MMSYETFKIAIQEQIMDYLPSLYLLYEPRIKHFPERHRYSRDQMILHSDYVTSITMSIPIIRLGWEYKQFSKHEDLDRTLTEIAENIIKHLIPDEKRRKVIVRDEQIIDAIKENAEPGGRPLKILFQTEIPLSKAILSVMNAAQNEERLKELPHFRVLDLAVTFKIRDDQEDDDAYVDITRQMMDECEIDEEALLPLAMENTKKLYHFVMESEDGMCAFKSWVMGSGGAVALVFKELLRDAAEVLEDDIYIIPCSADRIVTIPASGSNLDEIKQRHVNQNRALQEPQLLLSDNIYFYERERGNLRII